jgi:hypothetical protein
MNSREGQLPLALSSDREAIETAFFSSLASPETARVCRIKNTSHLDRFWASQALLNELEGDNNFSIESQAAPLDYDASGNLF